MVTVGTGIGGGIIIGGRIYRGHYGVGAELGHIVIDPDGPVCGCGNRGCWEAVASGTAIGRLARQRVEGGAGADLLAAVGGDLDAITGELVGESASRRQRVRAGRRRRRSAGSWASGSRASSTSSIPR